jgi:hypothetical protein
MVEGVEEFPAEYNVGLIPHIEVAHDGHVGVDLAGPIKDVTSRIAEGWIRS